MWVIFLQHLYLLLDWLLFRYEEIQDKLRELMVRVSWPSSCEVHFLALLSLLPLLALAPLIHGWCLSLTGFLVFRCWYWQQETINFKWWMEFNALSKSGGPLSLDSTLLLPGQRLMSTDGFRSLDSQQCATRDRPQCSVADCQNPTACASKRCLHCQHFYCATCASLSHTCPKSPSGHRFVSSLLTTRGREQPRTRSKVEKRKPKKEEGPPWGSKQCTMINRPQVLVCLGCDTLQEVDAQEGRSVCPICTLVNEPGKTKCELCDTELVSQAQADEAESEES